MFYFTHKKIGNALFAIFQNKEEPLLNVKEEPTDDKEGRSEEPQAITTDSGADIKKEPPDVSVVKVEEVVVLSDEESGKENEQVSQGAKLSFRIKNCSKKTCILNFA